MPWVITVALFLGWVFGCATADTPGGFADVCLIASAVMVLVSLFLGRRSTGEATAPGLIGAEAEPTMTHS